MSTVDPRIFMRRFGAEFARIAEGHPEQSKQAVLDQCVAMHVRHGMNVEQVLHGALVERSQEIVRGKLPPTSLVALILGQQGDGLGTLLTASSAKASRIPDTNPEDEMDLILNADDPLQVSFVEDDGRPVVKIHGLCDLTGPQARVPADLKPTFLEDLYNHLPPDDHRYVATGTLASNQQRTRVRSGNRWPAAARY